MKTTDKIRTMNFSATFLVNNTALWYAKNARELQNYYPNRDILKDALASKIITDIEGVNTMGGYIGFNHDFRLYFVTDFVDVKQNRLVNIRLYNEGKLSEQQKTHAFNKGVLYTTLAATMVSKLDTIQTPKYRLNAGDRLEVYNVKENFKYELWFNEKRYSVFSNQYLFSFYLNKLGHIIRAMQTGNMQIAMDFDTKYHDKEIEIANVLHSEISLHPTKKYQLPKKESIEA